MEDYRFTTDWFSWNIANWRTWLAPLAGKPNVKFLEIGCYEGRATVWLLGNILSHETAKIDCLDIFLDLASTGADTSSYESRFDYNIKTDPGRNKVRKIKAASQEALRNLELYWYDAIYIDGSHTACDVLEDAVLAFRLLRPGGVMIFDDYEWTGSNRASGNSPYCSCGPNPWLTPRMAIDSFLHVYEGQYELLAKAYQVAILKKSNEVDSQNSAPPLISSET